MAITTTFNKYGAPVSLIVKKGAESKYKARYGLAYPLVMDTTKVVTRKQSESAPGFLSRTQQPPYFNKVKGLGLIRNNLRQLLLTEKGERVMLPDYGVSLQKYLFEPLDETTFSLLKEEILFCLHKYFSIVQVLSLRVYTQDLASHDLRINLTLQLLDPSLDIFDIEVKIG